MEETTEQEKQEPRNPRLKGVKRWLNYQSVVKQVPFFLFLTVLAVVYIYNGHLADKTMRNINRTATEVKELEHEFKTVKSEVMQRSKQSELAKSVEKLGLKELREPAFVLYDSTTAK